MRTQAVFCILMIIGNIPFVSTAVVLIRRTLFRKKMADVVKHSHTMRRLVQDIEENRHRAREESNSSGSLRQRQVREPDQAAKGKQKQGDRPPKNLPPVSKSRTYHYQTGYLITHSISFGLMTYFSQFWLHPNALGD